MIMNDLIETDHHISVCICTFKRPQMLYNLLSKLQDQVTENLFTYSAIIVDNDADQSAKAVVTDWPNKSTIKIDYFCEPEQNIALARNKAVESAEGNFIAFIDDDETPNDNWLFEMYRCINDYNADAVLGPVLPDFPAEAPEWLKKSGLCNRPRNPTGSPITNRDLRTGNILFQNYVFEKNDMWFNPLRGRTGGEDGEFLSRQIKRGRKFIWCDEAIVFETVAEERWPASFYLKRQFRIGTMTGEAIRRSRMMNAVLKTITALIVYSVLLPFSLLLGKHIWVKILTKTCYNAGCVLSFFKVVTVQQIQQETECLEE